MAGYPFSLDDLPHRAKQYASVKPQRSVINVPDIEQEFLFPRDAVPAIDLRESSKPVLHVVTAHLLGSVEVEILH